MKLRTMLITTLQLAFLLFAMPLTSFAQLIVPVFGQPNSPGIGPRAIGMGGAFAAIADDASAVYWNPAGLSQVNSYEISVSSAPIYFQGNINPNDPSGFLNSFGSPWYSSLQLVVPIAKDNTLALSFFRPFHPQTYGNTFYNASTQNPATAEELSDGNYLQNPTFQESEIILSYAARFAGVNNFSVGINVKRITNDPYYIEYFPQDDPNINQALSNYISVLGFGVDLGLLYRIPITKYSEEFRVGLAFKDLTSQVVYQNGVSFTPSTGIPVQYNISQLSEPVPAQITLGLAYKNDYFFKVRNITDMDLTQISDGRFDSDINKSIHFGTEFWFFNDVVGLRGGYSSPLSSQGVISLGLSLRPLNGDLEADVAFLQQVNPSGSQTSGSQIASTSGSSPLDFENFYIGLTYGFGGGHELPPPKVSAFVRPASFTPSQGEKTTFFLDTSEDVTINHWTVLIYDQTNKLVRGMRGVGSPPSKLVWGGESDTYEPLPPGVYNWAFQVWDNLDHIGSTPVQTVEILGNEGARDPSKLLAMRQQQAGLLAQERQQLTTLAQQKLQSMLGIEPTQTPTVAPAVAAPADAAGNTTPPDAGSVPVMGFNNISPDQVLTAHFDKNAAGDPTIVVSYRSNLTYIPYLYNEATQVIRTTVNSVGTGMKEINTHVYYGKNELAFVTPSSAAANFAAGRIDEKALLQLSDVRVNGTKVGPNGY